MENTNSSDKQIIIEQHKPFSKCCLWKMQRDYFEEAGIDAWVNQVPFYITSNPFIAHCYAMVVMSFIQDTILQNPTAKNQTFYILELGTGSGRFSYYVIKTLDALRVSLGLTDVKFCYIMSDFTKNNIQYYEAHPALMPYIERGMVDFAIFDMEADKPITLSKENVRLTPEVLVNPLIVFANYIFDTVSHDAFNVQAGKLNELLLTIQTPEDNIQDYKPLDMEKLTVTFKTKEITKPYYGKPALDAILEEYKTHLKSSSFLFPTGSMHALQLLRQLANDKIFVIASDKGYSALNSLENLSHPSLSFHGSFSMMVNFHAIAQYFKNTGGDYFLQTPRKGIKTSVFCSGMLLTNYHKTQLALQQYVEGLSPADYFTLHRRMSDTFENASLEVLAAHLNLSYWDPHIYLKFANRIATLAKESDTDTIQFLAANMSKIAANYYFMPKSECVLFEIAVFFHTIKRYEDALHYYQEAEKYIGKQFGLFYNIALCQNNLGLTTDALKNFKKALDSDAQSKETVEWIAYLEKQIEK